jgi:hypothetical protein
MRNWQDMKQWTRVFRKFFWGGFIWMPDGSLEKCNVIGLLTNVPTRKERLILGANLVTNDGDHYYAQEAADEAALFTVAGMRLGTNAGVASAPQKTDVKLQTSTGSSLLVGSELAIDGTYPMSDDSDSDNTGAGVDVVTWRRSYSTSQANANDIASLDLPDNLTDGSITQSLCVANFSSKFDKTSSDTLKVFVNHTFTGV